MFDRILIEKRLLERELARTPPMFPLPAFNGQPPVLLVFEHDDPGIEIAYEKNPTAYGPLVRVTTRESSLFWIPRMLPVFCASDGKIIYARQHTDGYAILVEHRNGWASYYTRLEHMFVQPSDRRPRTEARVAAGDILGYVGKTKPGPLNPFRFELWRCDEEQEFHRVDPIRYMRRWRLARWNDAQIKPATT